MTRTLPLATLEDGEVKARPSKKPLSRAPRFTPNPTPEQVARARELFNNLSPGGQLAAIRFIEMLVKDEAGRVEG
jgi:hypothetical protein